MIELANVSPGEASGRVMIDSVADCQRWVGRKRHTVLGLAIGAGVGFATGAIVTSLDHPQDNFTFNEGDANAYFVLFCTGAGALLGTLTGALIKSDRWQYVPVERLRLGIREYGSGGVQVRAMLGI